MVSSKFCCLLRYEEIDCNDLSINFKYSSSSNNTSALLAIITSNTFLGFRKKSPGRIWKMKEVYFQPGPSAGRVICFEFFESRILSKTSIRLSKCLSSILWPTLLSWAALRNCFTLIWNEKVWDSQYLGKIYKLLNCTSFDW